MSEKTYDLIVIGGGPGGYVAAIRAAQLKMSVAVVEREHLGGICLNWGCIPTKALLRTSEVYHLMQNAGDFGLSAEKVGYDLEAIVKRSRTIAGQLNQGVKHLLKKNKVDVVMGAAQLAGGNRVAVKEKDKDVATLSAKNIMIATGARARELPHLKADGDKIRTYKDAMIPKEIPAKLLVIGSGAIGMEFASFYGDMGAKVTVVEMLERILPVEDEEISKLAAQAFTKQGMKLVTSASVSELNAGPDGVTAKIEKKGAEPESQAYDGVILAIGITGNVEGLGLEAAGVKVDKGHIVTDEWGFTGKDGLWAIGDVTGPPWLAHKAMHEGVVTVERIAGMENIHPMDKGNIPGCTYCRPQIASVGLSEAAAKEAGHAVKVGRFPFIGNGKAIALGETEGMIKTVFDAKSGELLGAHMIGAEVTELIQGYTIAKTLETTEAELINTIFPHPTLSEMMHESVLDAFERTLHF